MEQIDVVVVGVGPTGCMAAAEIARTGRSVVLLDRHPERLTETRAFGVHARTLELLDARGLADELVDGGARVSSLHLWGAAGIDLGAMATRFPYVLVTPQTRVDALLARYADAAGARIVRSTRLTAFEQDADGVTVHANGPDGPRSWRASYLVGADGAHSTVRELLGVDFPGGSQLRSMMLADVRFDDPPTAAITVHNSRDGFAFIAAFGDGWHRVVAADRRCDRDEHTPVTEGEIRRIVRETHGTEYGLAQVRWLSRFHCDERQVAQYRHGRVFLAGDAAHVHSPAGGQGMNTGIQDAANLGWKLAAVLGGGDPALLDTYQAERHPVGRMVLRSSGALIRLMTLRPTVLRILRDRVVGPLLQAPVIGHRAAGSVSGTGISYAHGRSVVGTRASAVALVDGTLAEAQRDDGFVLVLERTAPQQHGAGVVRRRDDGPALLVRPDGYVAWAGSSADGSWQRVLRSVAPADRLAPVTVDAATRIRRPESRICN